MAFDIPSWLETVLNLVPLLYALGYFSVPNPLAYAMAGLTASGFMIFFGYQMLGIPVFITMSLHLMSWVTLGAIISLIGRFRGMNALAAVAAPPGAAGPAPAPGTPGAAAAPNLFIIVGRVHEGHDPTRSIQNATVRIVGTGVAVQTDAGGNYRLEIPDTRWVFKRKVILSAEHPHFITQPSPPIKIGAGLLHTQDFPLEHILPPAHVAGRVSVRFATYNGAPAPNIVRRGQWFGGWLETLPPLTFDQPSGRPIPVGDPDTAYLVDRDEHRPVRIPGTLRTIPGLIMAIPVNRADFMGTTRVFIRGQVPVTYADGAPLPFGRDIRVNLVSNIKFS